MGVKGEETRARLIDATRNLIETQGYFGTGLNQVLAQSGAPRGSLYFHFPGGKDELVAQAISQANREVNGLIEQLTADRPSGPVLVQRLMTAFADRMEQSGYTKGCPLATVALETADSNEPLRRLCSDSYGSWQQALADLLTAEGRDAASAEAAAAGVLALLEGGLLLARVQHSRTPLEQAARSAVLLLGPTG